MKILVALFGAVVAMSAFADEGPGVSARVTCADIQAQISELSAEEEPDTETIDELTKLKADYRRSCSRAARGRKTSAGRVVVESGAETAEKAEEKNVDKPEENKKTEKEPVVVEEGQETEEVAVTVEPEVTTEEVVQSEEDAGPTEDELLEQELANLEAGLCADGTKPNKYGCCGDELFKDLGNAVFACCPKECGDCFPPIK